MHKVNEIREKNCIQRIQKQKADGISCSKIVNEDLLKVQKPKPIKKSAKCLTCSLNFHRVPTSTPGMGPKWFWGTMVHTFWRPAQAKPLPQSREVLPLAEAILAFFLLSFSFSPAFTISVSSFLHSGQNLQKVIKHPHTDCMLHHNS